MPSTPWRHGAMPEIKFKPSKSQCPTVAHDCQAWVFSLVTQSCSRTRWQRLLHNFTKASSNQSLSAHFYPGWKPQQQACHDWIGFNTFRSAPLAGAYLLSLDICQHVSAPSHHPQTLAPDRHATCPPHKHPPNQNTR